MNIYNPTYPYVTDKKSPLYNGQMAYSDLKRHLDSYKDNYNSSHLMILFGDDFMWENAQ
jgi:hypothetical protein